MLLDVLQKVFKAFCFEGEITKKDDNTFVLELECCDEELCGLTADYIFQDVMKAFTRAHNNNVLAKFNRIELDYDKFCKEGYIITEKHLEGYSETNWCFE